MTSRRMITLFLQAYLIKVEGTVPHCRHRLAPLHIFNAHLSTDNFVDISAFAPVEILRFSSLQLHLVINLSRTRTSS